MSFKAAERGKVPPFMVMDIMRDAQAMEASGKSVIHLAAGQPSTGIPRAALPRIEKALKVDTLGYTLAHGMEPLRDRIVRHYQETYSVKIPAESVVITTGSSGGFLLTFLSAFEIGDRVALAAPGYPAYRHILSSLGIKPELIQVDAGTRYQVTVDHLKKMSPLPDGLIIGSPANPTGTVVLRDDFVAIAKFCEQHGIRLISDEVYHGITYGPEVTTAAGLSENAVVLNSFSKYFSMTGWRVGWLIAPPDLRRSMECLAQNHFVSPPAISQHAALGVFEGREELEANVARYARNREILLKRLPELSFDKFAPTDGAFYLYCDVGRLTNDSQDFCKRLLHEAGVAATPGIDFDPFEGHHFVRFSFAGSIADIEEACDRIKKWRAGK